MPFTPELKLRGAGHLFSRITLGRCLAEVEVQGFRVLETWHPASLRLPRHDHEDPSINVVLSGAMRERVGGRFFECGPMMALGKPAGADHANQYGTTAVRCVVIQLPMGSGIADAWSTTFDDVRLVRSPIGSRLLRQLIAVRDDPADDSRLALFETVSDLLATITQTSATVNQRGTPAWLSRVRDQLNDSDRHEIRLSNIAMEAGVDAVTLCRAFTLAFGCAPSVYLRERRVARAAAALATGDGSLSGIAWQSGFSDQAHLTHVFRRLTGMTPGQYRTVMSGHRRLTDPLTDAGRGSAADPREARQRRPGAGRRRRRPSLRRQ